MLDDAHALTIVGAFMTIVGALMTTVGASMSIVGALMLSVAAAMSIVISGATGPPQALLQGTLRHRP